jgi:hypothetical protein
MSVCFQILISNMGQTSASTSISRHFFLIPPLLSIAAPPQPFQFLDMADTSDSAALPLAIMDKHVEIFSIAISLFRSIIVATEPGIVQASFETEVAAVSPRTAINSVIINIVSSSMPC